MNEMFRGAEIAVAMIMLAGALPVVLSGGFSSPQYGVLTQIMPDWAWGIFLTVTSVAHLAIIYINGRWHPSPWIRVAATCISFLVFMTLAGNFALSSGFSRALTINAALSVIAFICMLWQAFKIGDRHGRNLFTDQ